jgi:hypothetical protein
MLLRNLTTGGSITAGTLATIMKQLRKRMSACFSAAVPNDIAAVTGFKVIYLILEIERRHRRVTLTAISACGIQNWRCTTICDAQQARFS